MSPSPFLSHIPLQIDGNSTSNLAGLKGLSRAMALIRLSIKQPLVFLAKNRESANHILRDLLFILGDEYGGKILHLPALDSTPYQASSPDPILLRKRLATLTKLVSGDAFRVLVTTPGGLTTKTLPQEILESKIHTLNVGGTIHRDALISTLENLGYHPVNRTEDPGTFSVRGSIIDIYWPGSKEPVRVDLFGDEIERLHHFSPASQRTTTHIKSFTFGPVREYFFENLEAVENRLRDLADEVECPTKKLKGILADIDNHIPFFGIDALLPAFYGCLESPLQFVQNTYGPKEIGFVLDERDGVFGNLNHRQESFDKLYAKALNERKLAYPPVEYVESKDVIQKVLHGYPTVDISGNLDCRIHEEDRAHVAIRGTDTLRQEILNESILERGSPHARERPESNDHFLLKPLVEKLKHFARNQYTILIPLSSLGSVKHLTDMLEPHGVRLHTPRANPNISGWVQSDALDANDPLATKKPGLHAYVYHSKMDPPSTGVELVQDRLAIISEDDIFGPKTRRKGTKGKAQTFQTTLSDLNEGDCVVHLEHGIGEFRGLKKIQVRGTEQDYALIIYSGGDKLFLPVQHINLIQPYAGMGAKPRVDKLGSTSWATKKTKVKAAVLAMAQDLLNLYAKRELARRPAFDPPSEDYWNFEERFGFEATADQEKAFDAILADMQSQKPMDRLVCGDVGYGKTEVAMRAAMMCLLSGRQVAVLAPTTVLAQQHSNVFGERFRQSGAIIKTASRFQKKSDIQNTLGDVAQGKVDILVGTHRLLSGDVNFKNLGLVIVDEEQRFGIKAKEALKKLRAKSDFLTMSATPIPRTLQMSFLGIRDLSIIETPPVDRLAIRTSIAPFDDAIIKEGILREIKRGGQVYFVHNKVSTIEAMKGYIQKLVPEAVVDIGHGQMPERDLEQVMLRFVNQEFNVFICSTIVETGIDVATANTMFINDAQNFGLAQLYQLRGRIGRSKDRAFAYLVIPSSTENLTPVAKRRLEIIHEFSELGAGFRIAQHDLELRGAGDLLGKSQHGHVASVGYDLYADLLKEAVNALKGQEHEDAVDPDVSVPVRALIPEDYAVDLHERLGFYQKLATAENPPAIFDVLGEMEDLLGNPPEEVHNLAEVMIIKHYLRKLSSRSLKCGDYLDDKPVRIVLQLLKTDGIKLLKGWEQKESKLILEFLPTSKTDLLREISKKVKDLAG